MNLDFLKKTMKNAPIVKKGNYPYVIHPITDGVPKIEPKLLDEVTSEMQKRIEKTLPFDRIVTMEAMGIPLAASLSLKMNKPFVIIRKRSYGLPGEIEVEQKTGYSKSKLYINGLKKGDRIIIVDDVLSTGGTLKAVLSAFRDMEVIVKGVFIAINKGDAIQKISDEFQVKVDILLNIDIVNMKVVIKK